MSEVTQVRRRKPSRFEIQNSPQLRRVEDNTRSTRDLPKGTTRVPGDPVSLRDRDVNSVLLQPRCERRLSLSVTRPLYRDLRPDATPTHCRVSSSPGDLTYTSKDVPSPVALCTGTLRGHKVTCGKSVRVSLPSRLSQKVSLTPAPPVDRRCGPEPKEAQSHLLRRLGWCPGRVRPRDTTTSVLRHWNV